MRRFKRTELKLNERWNLFGVYTTLFLTLFLTTLSLMCEVFIGWIRYKNQELALNCGLMLRECFRYEELASIIMLSEDFYRFFEFVEVSTFDISSDAFLTFKV